jgi:predicted aminopeptidase
VEYLIESGVQQAQILKNRQPIEKVIRNKKTPEGVRKKLVLVKTIKQFAEKELALKPTNNYTTYVDLNREYISYLVRAAPEFELKHYQWDYPVVGKLPYKGFFKKQQAVDLSKRLKSDGYDTYVRGVSAYSTLGWFDDPVLSTMMDYYEHTFVDLIIHESVHATLFVPDAGDFNERLAVFIAAVGTRRYYESLGPKGQDKLKTIDDYNSDQKHFSKFISKELDELKLWYETNKSNVTKKLKSERLNQITERFKKGVLPQLKTKRYKAFANSKLNNAYLLSFQTYVKDLSTYQKVFDHFGKDLGKFLDYCKTLEDAKDPEKAIDKYANSLQ